MMDVPENSMALKGVSQNSENCAAKKAWVYLAARYSRRVELCGYREKLRALGFDVRARWLDGNHQLSDAGVPIGDDGETLVESGGGEKAARLREKFALDDLEDVMGADVVISFTETPRSGASRGGRHVEFGIALARGARCIAVGHRENIFHWLPQVQFAKTFEDAMGLLRPPLARGGGLDGCLGKKPRTAQGGASTDSSAGGCDVHRLASSGGGE